MHSSETSRRLTTACNALNRAVRRAGKQVTKSFLRRFTAPCRVMIRYPGATRRRACQVDRSQTFRIVGNCLTLQTVSDLFLSGSVMLDGVTLHSTEMVRKFSASCSADVVIGSIVVTIFFVQPVIVHQSDVSGGSATAFLRSSTVPVIRSTAFSASTRSK